MTLAAALSEYSFAQETLLMYGSKREIQVLTCLAYKFWIKAFSTSTGRQSPGTLQKMLDVTMMSLCRRTLKVTVHWSIPMLPKISVGFSFSTLIFPGFTKNWGKKFSRSCRIHRLLVATALENSLPWHRRFVRQQKTCSRILF